MIFADNLSDCGNLL